MSNTNFDALYEETSNDILQYAGTKLPDADPKALEEVITYTIHKCLHVAEVIMTSKTGSYLDILVKQAGREILKGE